jgi:hypothetical protein
LRGLSGFVFALSMLEMDAMLRPSRPARDASRRGLAVALILEFAPYASGFVFAILDFQKNPAFSVMLWLCFVIFAIDAASSALNRGSAPGHLDRIPFRGDYSNAF